MALQRSRILGPHLPAIKSCQRRLFLVVLRGSVVRVSAVHWVSRAGSVSESPVVAITSLVVVPIATKSVVVEASSLEPSIVPEASVPVAASAESSAASLAKTSSVVIASTIIKAPWFVAVALISVLSEIVLWCRSLVFSFGWVGWSGSGIGFLLLRHRRISLDLRSCLLSVLVRWILALGLGIFSTFLSIFIMVLVSWLFVVLVISVAVTPVVVISISPSLIVASVSVTLASTVTVETTASSASESAAPWRASTEATSSVISESAVSLVSLLLLLLPDLLDVWPLGSTSVTVQPAVPINI